MTCFQQLDVTADCLGKADQIAPVFTLEPIPALEASAERFWAMNLQHEINS